MTTTGAVAPQYVARPGEEADRDWAQQFLQGLPRPPYAGHYLLSEIWRVEGLVAFIGAFMLVFRDGEPVGVGATLGRAPERVHYYYGDSSSEAVGAALAMAFRGSGQPLPEGGIAANRFYGADWPERPGAKEREGRRYSARAGGAGTDSRRARVLLEGFLAQADAWGYRCEIRRLLRGLKEGCAHMMVFRGDELVGVSIALDDGLHRYYGLKTQGFLRALRVALPGGALAGEIVTNRYWRPRASQRP